MIVFCEYRCKCKECGKGFTVSTSIKKHVLTHIWEKLFDCKECGACFSKYGILKIHMRSHTEENPYICHECWKGFSVSDRLKKHILTHTREKPCIQEKYGVGYSKSSKVDEAHQYAWGEALCLRTMWILILTDRFLAELYELNEATHLSRLQKRVFI